MEQPKEADFIDVELDVKTAYETALEKYIDHLKATSKTPSIQESTGVLREVLRDKLLVGVDCPCCKQYVRLYKRKFNTVMARGLIKLYNLGDGFHHVSTIMSKISPSGSNDFSKLRYYGFIAEQENEDSAKRTSGMWKITEAGKDFALGNTSDRKYLFLYNKEEYRQPKLEGTTDIYEALGEKFDYSELMNS